ncbi:MAG: lipid-A-disaccharide synthase, partial [Deltaproteobacteria bacterium]|nr:lipid-A-disaccharide synthase [Deltaproteobacteria bacterium]
GEGAGALGPWPPPPHHLSLAAPQILIVAGEASGDSHAARLVAAIRELLPDAEFVGIGGDALAAQGVRLLYHAEDLAVVGLSEVLEHLPTVFKALRDVGRVLKRQRPALTILVDFPDFNFWVGRLAKFYRVPVMYYISPQVWAWRTYRVRTMARLADRIAVIFPFEADFYRQRGVSAEYVGHPLRETLPEVPNRQVLLKGWGLEPARLTVALLPGSRASEVRLLLPIMLEAAKILQKAIPQCQFVLPRASTVPVKLVEEILGEETGDRRLETEDRGPKTENLDLPGLPPKIIPGQSYQALAAAHLGLVASGTATVEAALAGTPTVIVYRVSPITFAAARLLVRVPHAGMANLLAGERMFPELLQHFCTPEFLAREALAWIRNPERLEKLRRGLIRVITRLGGPGASRRAARVAVELILGGGG